MRTVRLIVMLIALAGMSAPQQTSSGPELIRQSKLDEALQVYLRELQASPKSAAANNGAGVTLDLMGRPAEAQKYFAQAIKLARSDLEKALAQRAMAISFGFAGDCRGALKYERPAFDFYLAASDLNNAGDVADELGRICLEAGDLDTAEEWYHKGHRTALQPQDLGRSTIDLWDFRWAHARARIAARRGKPAEAAKLVASAKAILDKGTDPEQREYFPYLVGYVAFYAGDYPAALAALREASQTDPFIQCLMAQVYEKMGDTASAMAYYRKSAGSTAHSVPAAVARPLALRKLAAGSQ